MHVTILGVFKTAWYFKLTEITVQNKETYLP